MGADDGDDDQCRRFVRDHRPRLLVARSRYGWRAFDRLYLGPEALALGDDSYHQWRVGVHVTAFKTGAFEWSLGTGYVSDSDHRSGVYGRIGVLARR